MNVMSPIPQRSPFLAAALVGALASLTGCATMYTAMGYPPNPRRESPPPGVPASAVAADKPMPDGTLRDDKGATVQLSTAAREAPLLLVFYRGAWCPHCRAQLAELQNHLKSFQDAGVRVAAVCGEDAEQAQGLRKRLALTFELWTDPGLALTRAVGILDGENSVPWPAVYLVRKDGAVAWRWVAQTYKNRPTAVDVAGQLKTLAGPAAP